MFDAWAQWGQLKTSRVTTTLPGRNPPVEMAPCRTGNVQQNARSRDVSVCSGKLRSSGCYPTKADLALVLDQDGLGWFPSSDLPCLKNRNKKPRTIQPKYINEGNIMGQTIDVAVKGFSVTESIDPKSKTEVPAKFKPKAVTALKNVQVAPPKGKTLTAYSAAFTVAIKKLPQGVKAEIKFSFYDQDPYSKKDKLLAAGTSVSTASTTNPDKGDTEAVVDAALKDAIKKIIEGIQDKAAKP
jgi:hypothetical protein